jgi:hypothetical protein
MREYHDTVGYFWFPDKPEEKFDGIFSFSSEEGGGLVKTLGESIERPKNTFIGLGLGSAKDIPIICGFLQGIGDILLVKCKIYTQIFSDDIIFEYAVIGSDLPDSEPLFSSLSFSLTHLADWFVGETPIKSILKSYRDNSAPPEFEVKAKIDQAIDYEFDDFKISFFIGYSSKNSFTGITLETTATATISLCARIGETTSLQSLV